MRIGIIGASGMCGSAIYKLAKQQNPDLDVVGIARHEAKAKEVLGDDANLVVGDIFSMPESMLKDFDVIVDAFATSPEHASDHVKLAEKLVSVARNTKTRVIFILGAGSLHTGDNSHLVVEDIEKMPDSDSWINIPKEQLNELNYLKGIDDIDWLGISPAMTFQAGPATEYLEGKDDLLFNDQGESVLNSGTMATVVVREIEDPTHHRERITIANA